LVGSRSVGRRLRLPAKRGGDRVLGILDLRLSILLAAGGCRNRSLTASWASPARSLCAGRVAIDRAGLPAALQQFGAAGTRKYQQFSLAVAAHLALLARECEALASVGFRAWHTRGA